MKLTNINYSSWSDTKDTLHLFFQVIGKYKLQYAIKKNHWWHVTFFVTPTGLTTGTFHIESQPLEIVFNLRQHTLELKSEHQTVSCALPELSVKTFTQKVGKSLEKLGLSNTKPRSYSPFDANSDIAFNLDDQHATYNQAAVEEWLDNLLVADYFLAKRCQDLRLIL